MERLKVDVPTKARTPFDNRYIEMLVASATGELTDQDVRLVALNVAAKQRDDGEVRRDRFVPNQRESREAALKRVASMNSDMRRREFETREAALMMNASDAAILDEMEELEREVGLDMSEVEQAWYDYVVDGGDRPVRGGGEEVSE